MSIDRMQFVNFIYRTNMRSLQVIFPNTYVKLTQHIARTRFDYCPNDDSTHDIEGKNRKSVIIIGSFKRSPKTSADSKFGKRESHQKNLKCNVSFWNKTVSVRPRFRKTKPRRKTDPLRSLAKSIWRLIFNRGNALCTSARTFEPP